MSETRTPRFAAQTVLVTGANRGIGFALTQELLRRGHNVIATARDVQNAHELLALAKSHEPDQTLTVFPLDVQSIKSCTELAQAIAGRTIDVLVNNSGVSSQAGFQELTDEDFHRVMDINAMGPLRVVRAILPFLKKAKTRIFHISSIMGSVGGGPEGGEWFAYRMSKAALNRAGVSLAFDLRADGIASILVHPGWVQTDMGGKHATLTPAVSVRGIAMLIEEKGIESSGQFFFYDGTPAPW